jgi:hypothetical protein
MITDAQYLIGIDCGVHTGVAIWDRKNRRFEQIQSMPLHQALEKVSVWARIPGVHVRVEDARKRKWFGKSGREQLQGAGSVKRDAKIWEEFLTDNNISFEMVAPKNNATKLKAPAFRQLTGWTQKTNEHARDAAMLVFGL